MGKGRAGMRGPFDFGAHGVDGEAGGRVESSPGGMEFACIG